MTKIEAYPSPVMVEVRSVPHNWIDLLGPDRAIVGLGAVWPADAPRRLQRVAPES